MVPAFKNAISSKVNVVTDPLPSSAYIRRRKHVQGPLITESHQARGNSVNADPVEQLFSSIISHTYISFHKLVISELHISSSDVSGVTPLLSQLLHNVLEEGLFRNDPWHAFHAFKPAFCLSHA